MNYIQDIANLISIRNYLANSIDSMTVKLSRDEVVSIQKRISQLDRLIIDCSLTLELDHIGKPKFFDKFVLQAESTEDTAVVLEKHTKAKKSKPLPLEIKIT